jgi:lipopolysaccharide export system permease protein
LFVGVVPASEDVIVVAVLSETLPRHNEIASRVQRDGRGHLHPALTNGDEQLPRRVAVVREGVFQESKRADWVYFVEYLDVETGRVRNVFVHSRQREGFGTMVASEGMLETHENGDRFLVLLNGHRYDGVPGSPEYRIMDFERVSVRVEPAEGRRVLSAAKTRATAELLTQRTPINLAEFVWRLGLPLSALVLALLAIPLSSVNPRVGRSFNLLAAVFLYFLYSNCISISESLVATGKLAPWWAVVAVHGAMLLVVLLLFYRRLSLRWLPLPR